MKYKLNDIAFINPKEILKKGVNAKKISMECLHPFCRDIHNYTLEPFTGGAKFRNGDTIMARITPCLENGKIAKVNILSNDEVGFGSTEYIVFRAKKEVLDEDYLYYLICSPLVRNPAIKSMVGSSGRQRVQIDVIKNIEVDLPPLKKQKKIGCILRTLDDKIELNNKINNNLQQQAFILFNNLLINAGDAECLVSDIAYLNPKRTLTKNQEAKYIDMSHLSTSGSFPNGWDMKPFKGGMRFSNGDTLLARITPCLENGKAAFIDFLDTSEVAFGSTEYIVFSSKGQVPPEFLYCLVRYPAFCEYAVKNMTGSTGRQRVSAKSIGEFKIPQPSISELRKFEKIVSSLFLKIKFNSIENICLAYLRESLMYKLIFGELDVSEF